MATIPAKVLNRLTAGLKKFQVIVSNAKAKDINESDTVVIITDMLAELFGYDKYSEITSEQAIKKTFCDLAIKFEGKLQFIIEVKAAALELKEDYIRQAVNYGANCGVDWVILTNGTYWKVYKILFCKPVSQELVYEFDFTALSAKKEADLELLYCVCKESLGKSVLETFRTQKQTLSRFFIGQIILTEPVVDAIKKNMRKVAPDVKVTNEEILSIIEMEVLKREVLEGEKSSEAKKRIIKAFKAIEKENTKEIGVA
jgi:predicted type IV restriction endonuclease